ncbi:MAG: hypothetical protein E7492_03150 [Ruminococcaceae bacterium]|nr:hypothetical protein [Oscillospiraceae bacterium]
MIDLIKENIIKTGLYRYCEKEYHVYICNSDVLYGTGDYDDDYTGKDTEKECFYVWYEDILRQGIINAGGGYFETLDDTDGEICEIIVPMVNPAIFGC